MKTKQNKGITLVVLVVTIVILLILAGISIATLTNTGLFNKAKQAEQKSKEAQELENLILADYENKIGGTRENIESKESEYIKSVDLDIECNAIDIKLKINTNIEETNKLLGYHYFVRKVENGTLVKAGILAKNAIDIGGLEKNTSYNVNVVAYDIDNNYKKSSVKEIKTLDSPIIEITDINKLYIIDTHADKMNATAKDVENILFNGNINEGGSYKGILLNPAYPSSINFTVTKKIKLYAYGHGYSDSSGWSGKNIIIQKYNDATGQYENYKTVETKADGNKYELVDLEPGKYYITPAGRYVTFDEWEYEVLE